MTAGRRATLADVARAAGVSPALVSIVMRDVPGASAATRERVRAEARRLGYRPDARARLLRSARSRLVGVVFDVEQPFHADLLEALYEAADAAGWALALSAAAPSRPEDRALTTLLDDRCEALVLLGSRLPEPVLAGLAAERPVVVLARAVTDPAVDSVRSDDAAGARAATEHLLALGHRTLVHVDGGDAPGSIERRTAFVTSAGPAGRVLTGGPGEADGARVARELLDRAATTGEALPTGVVAFNDRCATGLLDAFARAGVRVPEDVSVTGHDDSRLARLAHVDLTSVGQDAPALARLALARAVCRAAPADRGALVDPGGRVVTRPHLVVRGSTAAPR